MATSPPRHSGLSSTSSLSLGHNLLQRDDPLAAQVSTAMHTTSAATLPKAHASPSHTTQPIPVETLVNHLLAAKGSLSCMEQVLRANDIVYEARREHEVTAVRTAHVEFLRHAIIDQASLLIRVRYSLQSTYDSRRRAFKFLIRTMDIANEKLQATIAMLRATVVQPALRPSGEEAKSLMDFVDENGVHNILETMKTSLADLQLVQQSFDGDLLRFDNDIRALRKLLSDNSMSMSLSVPSPSASGHQSNLSLVASLSQRSHVMAQMLSDLTRHFDLCVTAVRITDDGSALLASRKDSADNDDLSISGVTKRSRAGAADDGSLFSSSLDSISSKDRDDILRVVVNDAAEVDLVVAEINEHLMTMEEHFGLLHDQAKRSKAAQSGALAVVRNLEEMEKRLGGYVEAEGEFISRWQAEQAAIAARLDEMEELHVFYQSYASAYDSLVLEVERRRTVDDKIAAVWRKAREAVDRLAEADGQYRDTFRQDVGGFLPTDLWPGMCDGLVRWDLVMVCQPDGGDSNSTPKPAPLTARLQ